MGGNKHGGIRLGGQYEVFEALNVQSQAGVGFVWQGLNLSCNIFSIKKRLMNLGYKNKKMAKGGWECF